MLDWLLRRDITPQLIDKFLQRSNGNLIVKLMAQVAKAIHVLGGIKLLYILCIERGPSQFCKMFAMVTNFSVALSKKLVTTES